MALCFLGVLKVAAVEMPVSFSEVLALEHRRPNLTLTYGNEPSQTASLWIPLGRGTHPVVMLVHGGCWLEEYDASHIYPLASSLARDGYAVWVPEYRRVGESGGGWPGTASDVVQALDRLAQLRDPRLSLERTVVVGHSAGGHLGLWMAARDPALVAPPVRVVAAVGLAAITDLQRYARGENSCEVVTQRFMGGTPETRGPAYRQASPALLPQQVPVTLLRGGRDAIVDAAQASAMAGADTVVLEGAGHFDWIHPLTPAYDVLRDALFHALEQGMRHSVPSK